MPGYDYGTATASIQIEARDAVKTVNTVRDSLLGLKKSTLESGNVQGLGKGLAAFGAGVVGAFGLALNTAANFEQAMDGVGASLNGVGTATGITQQQFSALSTEAQRIGATTSASAIEAAQAMELMAKAGTSVEDILNGGAQAAVNISEATGEGLQQSSETMSAMLLLFQDTGLEAGRAADIIVSGMNASSATMSEFQTGIARLAPVISSTGMSFEEAAAEIAYFNSLGLSAAEVGTSLTSAYTRLADPTTEAASKMDELGIAAFDAQGKFIGFPALFDQVAAATAGMSDEQRTAALSTIFGADALDVMTLASQNGGDGVRGLTDDMQAQGTAAAASAERMDNLKGSIEQLRGAIEGVMIVVGTQLLPFMQAATDAATGLVTAFLELSPTWQKVIAAGIGVAGMLSLVGGGFLLLAPRILSTVNAVRTLSKEIPILANALRALSLASPWLLALVAAVALVGLAWKTNFLGIGDALSSVFGKITGTISKIIDTFHTLQDSVASVGRTMGFVDDATGGIVNPIRSAADAMTDLERTFHNLGAAIKMVTGLPVVGFFDAIGSGVQRALDAFNKIKGAFADINDAFQEGGFGAGLDALFGDLGRKLLAGIGDALASLPKMLGEALGSISTGFKPVDMFIQRISRTLVDIGRLVQEIFQGDISGALKVLERLIVRTLFGPFRELAALIDSIFGTNLLGSLDRVLAPVKKIISSVFSSLGSALNGLLGRWKKSFGKMGDALGDIAKAFKKGGLKGAMDALFGKSGRKLLAGFGDALSALPKAAGEFLRGIQTPFGSVNKLLGNLGDIATDSGRLVQELFQGDWAGALTVGKRLLGDFVDLFKDFGGGMLDNARTGIGLLGDALRAIPWGDIGQGALDLGADILSGIGEIGSQVYDWISGELAQVDWNQIGTDVSTFVSEAFDLLSGEQVAGRVTGWLQRGMTAVVGAIPTVAAYLGELGLRIASFVAGLFVDLVTSDTTANVVSWLGRAMLGVVEKIPTVAAYLGELGLRLATFVAGLFVDLATSDTTANVLDWLKRGFLAVVEQIPTVAAYLGELGLRVATFVASLFEDLDYGEIAGKVVAWLQDAMLGVVEKIPTVVAYLGELGPRVISFVTGLWDTLNGSEIAGKIVSWLISAMLAVVAQIPTVMAYLGELGPRVIGFVVGLFANLDYGSIGSNIVGWLTAGMLAVVQSIPTILAYLGELGPKVISFVTGLWSDLDGSDISGAIGTWLSNGFSLLVNNIPGLDTLSSVGSQIADAITKPFSSAFNALENLLEPIIRRIVNTYNTIAKGINKLNPLGPDIPTINLNDLFPPEKDPVPQNVADAFRRVQDEARKTADAITSAAKRIKPSDLRKLLNPTEAEPEPAPEANPPATTTPSATPTETPTEVPTQGTPTPDENGKTYRNIGTQALAAARDLARFNATVGTDAPRAIDAAVRGTSSFGRLLGDTPKVTDTVTNAFRALSSSGFAGLSTATASVSGDFSDMGTSSIGSATGMKSGVGSAIGGMAKNSADSASGMKSGVTGSADSMRSGVTNSAEGMRSGVVGSTLQMAGQAVNIMAAMVAAMTRYNLYSDGYGIASSLGEGLLAGLAAYALRVAASMAGIVSAGISAANAAGLIRSPSKKTAYTGDMLGLGLFQSVQRWQQPIADALAALITLPRANTSDLLRYLNTGFAGTQQQRALVAYAQSPLGSAVPSQILKKVIVNQQLRTPEFMQLLENAERGADFAAEWLDDD